MRRFRLPISEHDWSETYQRRLNAEIERHLFDLGVLISQTNNGGGGGVSDHGQLLGLEDHDHLQYSRLAAAETHTAGKGTEEVVLTSVAGAVSLTANDSNAFYLPMTEAVTLTVGDGRTGQVLSIAVRQDATGGRALTLAGNVLEVGSLDVEPNAYSHISLRWVSTGTWLAVISSGFA